MLMSGKYHNQPQLTVRGTSSVVFIILLCPIMSPSGSVQSIMYVCFICVIITHIKLYLALHTCLRVFEHKVLPKRSAEYTS